MPITILKGIKGSKPTNYIYIYIYVCTQIQGKLLGDPDYKVNLPATSLKKQYTL